MNRRRSRAVQTGRGGDRMRRGSTLGPAGNAEQREQRMYRRYYYYDYYGRRQHYRGPVRCDRRPPPRTGMIPARGAVTVLLALAVLMVLASLT